VVTTTAAGVTVPNSSCGGFGLEGTNSLGSSDVGFTVLEILELAAVKKLSSL
jgi:hypothetical protein